MKTISRPNQYLQQRGEVWYYIRRVPTILTEKIGRRIISRSLETDSVSTARRRRDMCADADDARWNKLIPSTLRGLSLTAPCGRRVRTQRLWALPISL